MDTLEERSYNSAYQISNDWAKEEPEWTDVMHGYKMGVKETMELLKPFLRQSGIKPSKIIELTNIMLK